MVVVLNSKFKYISVYTDEMYQLSSKIRGTFDKKIDYSDVVGASPVGAAPTISSFST